MHRHTGVVRLYHTDAAGLLFHGSIFLLFHDACEEALAAGGLEIGSLLESRGYSLPVVHSEADFAGPLRAGERVVIDVWTGHVGTTSFTLRYRAASGSGAQLCSGSTVHAVVSKDSGSAIPVPPEVREMLGALTPPDEPPPVPGPVDRA